MSGAAIFWIAAVALMSIAAAAFAVPLARRGPGRGMVVVAILVAIPGTAVALYLRLGNPHLLEPMSAADFAGTDADRMLPRLLAHLARNPGDGRGWVLAARAHAAKERFVAARDAYAQALRSDKVRKDPGVVAEYADIVGTLAGGSLKGEPERLLHEALALDPRHPRALELAGSAAIERKDYATALNFWSALEKELKPDDASAMRLHTAIMEVREKQRLAPIYGETPEPMR